MSVVYVPDNLTAPELWYPDRKPSVPVKLNWDHPLTKGLVCAYLENVDTQFILDSVKRELRPIGNSSINDDGTINVSGEAIAIGGSELVGANGVTITARAAPTTNVDMAFIGSRLVFANTDNHLNMRFDRVGAQTGNNYCIKASVKNVSPVAESISNVWSSGVMGTYSMTWNQATRFIDIYYNGEDVSDDGGSVAQDSLVLEEGQLFIGSGFGTRFTGLFSIVLVHNRKLSAEEIKSLHDNPYQILVPS